MELKEVSLKAFNIAGFIEFNSSNSLQDVTEDIEFSSWGEERERVCPYCGEDHNLKIHNEINWEELYLPHKLLKENLNRILDIKDNIEIPGKKYEIIKIGNSINQDIAGYNIAGIKVHDLNRIPIGFIGMRFPEKKYLSLKITMEEFYNSEELDSFIHKNDSLDDYFIIEYDLENKVQFNKLYITLYYPYKD